MKILEGKVELDLDPRPVYTFYVVLWVFGKLMWVHLALSSLDPGTIDLLLAKSKKLILSAKNSQPTPLSTVVLYTVYSSVSASACGELLKFLILILKMS